MAVEAGPLIAGCSPQVSCVSTSAVNAPRSFMPPWTFEPLPQDKALRSLLDELNSLSAEVTSVSEETGRVAASVAYGRLPNGAEDVDDVVIVLRGDGVVLFRSQSRQALPDPPFCWKPNCVNGPRNRERMERLRDVLGWTTLETDEDKQWRQIFLH